LTCYHSFFQLLAALFGAVVVPPYPVEFAALYCYLMFALSELYAIDTSRKIMTTVMSSITSSSYFHFLNAALTKALAAASGAFCS